MADRFLAILRFADGPFGGAAESAHPVVGTDTVDNILVDSRWQVPIITFGSPLDALDLLPLAVDAENDIRAAEFRGSLDKPGAYERHIIMPLVHLGLSESRVNVHLGLGCSSSGKGRHVFDAIHYSFLIYK